MSEAVTNFLDEFKRVAEAEGLHVIPRNSHNATVTKLGLTGSIVKEIILNLTAKHYQKGPMVDRDSPGTGDLYVFQTDVDGVTIYIKLKIDFTSDGYKIAKCISFHE